MTTPAGDPSEPHLTQLRRRLAAAEAVARLVALSPYLARYATSPVDRAAFVQAERWRALLEPGDGLDLEVRSPVGKEQIDELAAAWRSQPLPARQPGPFHRADFADLSPAPRTHGGDHDQP